MVGDLMGKVVESAMGMDVGEADGTNDGLLLLGNTVGVTVGVSVSLNAGAVLGDETGLLVVIAALKRISFPWDTIPSGDVAVSMRL